MCGKYFNGDVGARLKRAHKLLDSGQIDNAKKEFFAISTNTDHNLIKAKGLLGLSWCFIEELPNKKGKQKEELYDRALNYSLESLKSCQKFCDEAEVTKETAKDAMALLEMINQTMRKITKNLMRN